MANLLTILLIYSISLLQLSSSSKPRRILHEPLFPIQWTPPPPPLQPSDPFPTPPSPFFPDSPPQTPSLPSSSAQPSNHQRANSSKNVIIGVSVLFAFLALLAFSGFFLYRRRIGRPPDTRKLIGGGGGGGGGDEGVGRFQQAQAPEFLYLGTMEPTDQRSRVSESIDSPYRKLSSERVEVGAHHHHHPSPELQPLPPLVGTGVAPRPAAAAASSDDDDASFYTPNRSVASSSLLSESSTSPVSRRSVNASSGRKEVTSRRTSPRMQLSDSPPSHIKHAIQPPLPPVPPPPPPPLPPPLLPPKVEKVMRLPPLLPPKVEKVMGPPPPPPPQFPDDFGRKREILEASMANRPSSRRQLLRPLPPLPPEPASRLSNGSGSSLQLADEVDGKLDGEERPKLKPLHWDKVRASSDRAMVWDQLKSSSFQLNEDMIETLFIKNAGNPPTETSRRHVLPTFKQENRVLDPKKSQNIAILLRALNVTREEVTDALLDGNLEGLGVELFETLVKMAPTKEEELKLRDYNGDVSKLGSAETFLKAVLDIPFAFKRVDAMLYRANFESEVRFLRKSYETLEAACEDLSSSRLFLKLLEAVLRTGNRINSGTNRGAATAFKLDTLLKLVDVKGTDGKTTLLHFVVQEIIRSEGSTSDSVSEDPPNKGKAEEFRKQGLKVLSGLSSELGNVKKAAGMDSDVLSSYVKKLELGLEKIRSVLNLERSCEQGLKFFDSMKVFLTEAEAEIGRVKDEEKKAIGLVKEITEYFHGDAAKEEAHPLRIFMVVRDFLSVLDNVCKEVGRIQERAMMGSARISSSASLPVLHRYDPRLQRSSDEDSLSS